MERTKKWNLTCETMSEKKTRPPLESCERIKGMDTATTKSWLCRITYYTCVDVVGQRRSRIVRATKHQVMEKNSNLVSVFEIVSVPLEPNTSGKSGGIKCLGVFLL